ncbi:MAG: aminotransferase class I/II-fold pyridoxal phosphate-dependent enzyme [Methanobacteriota archaeon]|nr:MAG: aminotransferase class I/II-fold pyridoxal phosphate-dependent enzyme [Euryarchaeota archaeon]
MRQADRLAELPPYLFEQIDSRIRKARAEGVDIISFGIGDPDLPTPPHIVEACKKALDNPENHRYPSSRGMDEFRGAVADRYKADFGVEVDPEREVTALIGSKEGIHNIHLAYVNPGDAVLYPEPGYPVYRISPGFCGGQAYPMPLKKERGFLPDLGAIPEEVSRKARIIWLNYPNNPTAATATKGFYREVVDFARDNDLIVCSDEAYSAIAYDGYRPPSLLEVEGALEVGVVFNSLSKTYNMTGWRIGYALGNEDIIGSLVKLKSNVDSGACRFIQEGAVAALTSSQDCVRENVKIYQSRRDILVKGLRSMGFAVEPPKATFYVWMETPEGDSMAFASRLLDAGVVVTPGVGFGRHGEGFVRFALTQPAERIAEALERMERIL